MKNRFLRLHLDFLGFSASLLCAIHCAVLPLLLTIAPLASLKLLDNHLIESIFILTSFLIASSALITGYKQNGKRPHALILGILGFFLIGIGQLSDMEWQEATFTSTGGLIIAIAHFVNWKIKSTCKAN